MFSPIFILSLLGFTTLASAGEPHFKTIIAFGSGGENYSHFPRPLSSDREQDVGKINKLFVKFPGLQSSDASFLALKPTLVSLLASGEMDLAVDGLLKSCRQPAKPQIQVIHSLYLDSKHPDFVLIDGDNTYLNIELFNDAAITIQVESQKTPAESVQSLLVEIKAKEQKCILGNVQNP